MRYFLPAPTFPLCPLFWSKVHINNNILSNAPVLFLIYTLHYLVNIFGVLCLEELLLRVYLVLDSIYQV